MKKLMFTLAIAISLVSCSKQDPAEYNNKMMTIINASQTDMDKMNSAMSSGDFAKAEEVRKSWEGNLEKSIKEVEAVGDFNGDSKFKDAVLKSMNGYKDVVKNDYKTLIEIRKNGKPEDMGKEQATLDKINASLEKSGNDLNTAASTFETEATK